MTSYEHIFANAWSLYKASFRILRKDRELMWLPFLGLFAYLGLTACLVATAAFALRSMPTGMASVTTVLIALYVHFFLVAFVCLFVNMMVIAAATDRLLGGNPTLATSWRAAWHRRGRLAVWAALTTTGAVLLVFMARSAGPLGRLLSTAGGIAWELATVFVMPVLLYEEAGVRQALRKSEATFRNAFGETVTGLAGISVVTSIMATLLALASPMVFAVLPMLVAGWVGAQDSVYIGIIIGSVILWFTVLFGVIGFGAVLQGIYKAALYAYAKTGRISLAYEDLGLPPRIPQNRGPDRKVKSP